MRMLWRTCAMTLVWKSNLRQRNLGLVVVNCVDMAKNGIGGKKQVKFKMQINMRSVLIWLFVLLVILPFLTSMVGQTPPGQELTITQALEDVKEGKVESL